VQQLDSTKIVAMAMKNELVPSFSSNTGGAIQVTGNEALGCWSTRSAVEQQIDNSIQTARL